MKLESISKKTGKITAKTLGAIKSAPKATGNKTKSIKDAFVSGYKSTSPSPAPTATDLIVDDLYS